MNNEQKIISNEFRSMSLVFCFLFFVSCFLFGLILPSFVLAQDTDQPVGAPQTIEGAKDFVMKILKAIPEALKGPWQEAVGIWQKMADWFKNFWDSYVFPFFQNIWQKILAFLGKEIEVKKQEIKEEIEKEKEEIKEEIKEEASEAGKSLWERLKDLIKDKIPGI